MEATPWVNSQSGRRKQVVAFVFTIKEELSFDYGPKANFKKKKLKLGCFNGLPAFCKTLVERMQRTEQLRDFVPVELCDLEYVPDRGSAIDPHFDDFWLWGERLVTLNLLSDTYLTLSKDDQPGVEVLVPMPRKSLIIVSGPARFQWKHAIKRDHIQSRRIAMTFRELAPEFLEGGPQEDTGRKMIDLAKTFRGVAVGGQLSLIQS
ncbi:alpha-ketoglutarate-dependent dioxygenase alkB homolog 4 [Lingula anatina]|uniref:Alpha-ketoglutarate-dependent dioxygenase alkB homolog 4 n=1 Tax=Lingula anatina TaxID=7574 RepID=A0A1S3H0S0_LINAN|nr:alpha-ketoglutarate-dependent dioxygenase alkB homolog 4 [Lingula anatina]|eukprot:XP_013379730.1 alpha-ketoglutarate-dependent dioxygenase alkB homolog 4 [Lingula anatina]